MLLVSLSGFDPMRENETKRKLRTDTRTTMAKSDEVLTLLKGGMGATEVVQKLKIGRASVYRIIEAATAK
jgi:DNA invertase Pin-like site-specific DNA recombinase